MLNMLTELTMIDTDTLIAVRCPPPRFERAAQRSRARPPGLAIFFCVRLLSLC